MGMVVIMHFLCAGRGWNWNARWCHVRLSQALAQLVYHGVSRVLASAMHRHFFRDGRGLLVVAALLGLYVGVEA